MEKIDELNVLIVEDELITAEAIAVLIKKLGYHPVAIVSSGEEAISSLENIEIDLILMDIILSGNLDGIKAAKIINKHHNIPIIFITAYGDRNTLNRAKLSEPYGYIVKPVTDESDLLPTIEIAIYNHRVKKKLKIDNKKLEKIKEFIEKDTSILGSEGVSLENLTIGKESRINMDSLEITRKIVNGLKSIASPERLHILEALKTQALNLDDAEALIEKSQSTTSHHIKKLEDAELIKGWKDGKYTNYTLNKQGLLKFANFWEEWLKQLSL